MTKGTSRWNNYLAPERMDAATNVKRSKHYGYISRKNEGTRRRKRRNESRNHALGRIHSTRREYAKRTRRRKSEGSMRS